MLINYIDRDIIIICELSNGICKSIMLILLFSFLLLVLSPVLCHFEYLFSIFNKLYIIIIILLYYLVDRIQIFQYIAINHGYV